MARRRHPSHASTPCTIEVVVESRSSSPINSPFGAPWPHTDPIRRMSAVEALRLAPALLFSGRQNSGQQPPSCVGVGHARGGIDAECH
mmetsp:Transcript_28789/g.88265  ORF Transcript_28789/g.88265 Transcript_28789/m.88265 type:complete len:88 (+) Transcript_28789:254-517(+)|eukprot:scaffold190585_cov40-Tisochrysis_lutea.AAC.1